MNAKNTKANENENPQNGTNEVDRTCGVIMPIAAMGDYSESHWRDVKKIIDSAVETAGFKPNLVSSSTHVGVILKRIVNNIYDNPIVVCDVSGKNPNVMFELGLRLAFDKPVVIIKDDQTSYSFDTSVIEHINYRRDLRIHETNYFIEELAEKIRETHRASESDKQFSPFLKQFGEFEVKKIQHKSGSFEDVILSELAKVRIGMEQISNNQARADKNQFNFLQYSNKSPSLAGKFFDIPMIDEVQNQEYLRGVTRAVIEELGVRSVKEIFERVVEILGERANNTPISVLQNVVIEELRRAEKRMQPSK